ncbi:MAG: YlbF family regulator [Eubacterium sp.]|nr:YlbF family regulator [Eubacterium sp.]
MKKEKEEQRKQQIKEIMEKTQELCDLILNSVDYVRYRRQLEELKKSGETYQKLNEYRLKALSVQLLEDPEQIYEKTQELYTEYSDLLNEPLVVRFMLTEQTICKTMRTVQNQVFEGIDLDISYMN